MSKMHIERSIDIDASVEKVFQVLNDFNQWAVWSPWLLMDEHPNVRVSKDAKFYEWEGKRTGSGKMQIISEEENKTVEIDLNFLKPWKSQADVRFEVAPNADGSKVTWFMDSGWPFYLFFMKKMMMAYVGADYERGLDMLKAYVETGTVPSKLEFKGESIYQGCNYVGIKTTCSIDDVGSRMESDFGKLMEYEANNSVAIAEGFSIYHKWDLVKNLVSYSCAIPVKEAPSDLPSTMVKGSIPMTRIYTIRHVGRYQHLGNAWATFYSMHRGKEIKVIKGIHPFEIYRNNPREVDEKDLITDVNFAIK